MSACPEAIPEWLRDALRELAQLRGGEFREGARTVAWFDGFWDFFVPARTALERGPAAAASGTGFCAIAWMPEEALRLDLFIERKDRRSVAGAPVCTIALQGGERLEPAPTSRRIEANAAAALSGLGARVQLGHWGPHLTFLDPRRIDSRSLDRLISLGEQLVPPERRRTRR